MPFPSFLKSAPFMVAVGTIGVGGVGITIWQTTGLSTSAQTEHRGINSPISDDSPEPEISKIALDDDFLNTYYSFEKTDPNFHSLLGPFRLSGHGCFKNFFPGKSIAVHDKYISEDPKLAPKTKEELLVPVIGSVETGNIQGCTTVSLSHKNDNFVFKSETIIKNEKIALALWTGINRREFEISHGSPYMWLRISQYLVFLENDESQNRWVFKGGYSWTPDEFIFSVKSLQIKSPDGRSIDKAFENTSSSVETKWTTLNYSGVWEPSLSDGGSTFFKLNDEDYDYAKFTADPAELVLFSNELRGYKKANRFYKQEGGDFWNWRRHRKSLSSFEEIRLDVGDSIKQWYAPFEKSKGFWKSLNEYCQSKGDRICKGNWY